MERLCERPGCSELSSVAYGMRPEDLVFWLDVLREANRSDSGVLCQRHADSMVVPRGWTLDDLRDPDLHLFRPPAAEGQDRTKGRRSRATNSSATEQLTFSVESGDEIVGDAHVVSAESAQTGDAGALSDPDLSDAALSDAALSDDPPEPWTPTFDDDDDLDGLLTAQSPLLARAFRGPERRSPS
jgi:hypothetical protein